MPKSTKVSAQGAPVVIRTRRDKEIAGVGVGMEEAVQEQLVEHHLGKSGRHFRRFDAGGPQAVHVGDLDRGDVLEGEHSPGGALPRHRRDPDPIVVRKVCGKSLGVRQPRRT